jgi:4-amino-4-deoxy-L-arabinose transferase-like glycosyltransferase
MIKWTLRQVEHYGFITTFLLAFILMAWDIGNLDAIRQGTEGFYLQISKEMSEANSWLTPLYRGEPHWSKPPLHFWLPFPLYSLGLFETTTAARLTILVFSLVSVSLIANWIERFFSINRVVAALFLVSTIAFAKYSRIFMMEMPLSLLSTLAALYLFSSLKDNRKIDWLGAVVFSSLAVLVKGPVAWVMIGTAMIIYLMIRFRLGEKMGVKPLLVYFVFTLILGSLWFLACYLTYGREFLDYFFLRENLGKFTSQSYPIRVVFQGLLIFSLPWSLYLPVLINRQGWAFRLNRNEVEFWPRIFIIVNFIVFFSLWLIPNQRSHHYAMPSIFFFLIILLDALKCHTRKLSGFGTRLSNWLAAGFFFSLLPLLFVSFVFPSLFESTHHILVMGVAIALAVFAFIAFARAVSLKTRALAALLCLGFTWSFVTPLFILPTIPERIFKIIGERPIAVVYRKPYFIEEALERPAQAIIGQDVIATRLNEVEDLLFIPENLIHRHQLEQRVITLERWRVWQKNRRLKDILSAISRQDLASLQEWLVLAQIRP